MMRMGVLYPSDGNWAFRLALPTRPDQEECSQSHRNDLDFHVYVGATLPVEE
jgi:hypothetical protein